MEREAKDYTQFKKTIMFLHKFLGTWPGARKIKLVGWKIVKVKTRFDGGKLIYAVEGTYIKENENLAGEFMLKDGLLRRRGKTTLTMDTSKLCNSTHELICRYYGYDVNSRLMDLRAIENMGDEYL